MYLYVHNNPVNGVDPLGLSFLSWVFGQGYRGASADAFDHGMVEGFRGGVSIVANRSTGGAFDAFGISDSSQYQGSVYDPSRRLAAVGDGALTLAGVGGAVKGAGVKLATLGVGRAVAQDAAVNGAIAAGTFAAETTGAIDSETANRIRVAGALIAGNVGGRRSRGNDTPEGLTGGSPASSVPGGGDVDANAVVSKNYRKTFTDAYPDVDDVVVHHGIEQQAMKRYPEAVTETEMHSLQNLRGIPKDINSEVHLRLIRKEWNRFYRQNPAATGEQLRLKRAEIDSKYGDRFNPPVKSD